MIKSFLVFGLMLSVFAAGTYSFSASSATIPTSPLFMGFNAEKDVVQFADNKIIVADPITTRKPDGHLDGNAVKLYTSLDYQYANDLATVAIYPHSWPGEQDPSFMLVQKDKKILLAVISQKTHTGWRYLHLVRFLPEGGVDTTFGTQGTLSLNQNPDEYMNHYVNSVFETSDRNIYVIERVCDGYSCQKFLLIQISEQTGKINRQFGNNGYLTLSLPSGGLPSFYPTKNGFLLNLVDHNESSIYKFDLSGRQVSKFNSGLKSLGEEAKFQSLEILDDGKIIISGQRPDGSLAMTRLLEDGKVDSTFGKDGYLETSESTNFGLLPSWVGYGATRSCGGLAPALSGKTYTDEQNIYVVSPIVISKAPSKHTDVNCSLSGVAIAVATYTLNGKLISIQQSAKVGEVYAAWRLKILNLSKSTDGSHRGMFFLGDHAPNDIRPALANFNGLFSF